MRRSLLAKIFLAAILILILSIPLTCLTALAQENVNWKSNTQLGNGITYSAITNTVTDWESMTYEASGDETADSSAAPDGSAAVLSVLAGLAGLLGITVLTGTALSKKEITSILPEGNGLWVPEADRESVIGLINKAASKTYCIDENGFVKETAGVEEDSLKSGSYSKILDILIAGDKKIVIGEDSGWLSYNQGDDSIQRESFTGGDSGISIGDNGTDQVVVVSGQNETAEVVLAHELIHALRGEYSLRNADTDGGVNQDEETNTVLLENTIRKELGLGVRALEDPDEADVDWLDRLEKGNRELSGTIENHDVYGSGYPDYSNGYDAYGNYNDYYYPDHSEYSAYSQYSESYSEYNVYSQYSQYIPPTPPALGNISISTPSGTTTGSSVTVSASCSNADHLWMWITDPDGNTVYNGGNGSGSSMSKTITASIPGTYTIRVDARNTPGSSDYGTDYKSAPGSFIVSSPPPPTPTPPPTGTTGKTVLYKNGHFILLDSNILSEINIKITQEGWSTTPPSGILVYRNGLYAVINSGEISSYVNSGWTTDPLTASQGTSYLDAIDPDDTVVYNANLLDYFGAIWNSIKNNPKDFVYGIADGLGDGFFFGVPQDIVNFIFGYSPEPDTLSYEAGKVLGDIGAMYGGAITALLGVGEEVGGIALDATGIGAIFGGIELNIAGVATIAYGGTVAVAAAGQLGNDLNTLFADAKNVSSGGIKNVSGNPKWTKYDGGVQKYLSDNNLIEQVGSRTTPDGTIIREVRNKSTGELVGYTHDNQPVKGNTSMKFPKHYEPIKYYDGAGNPVLDDYMHIY